METPESSAARKHAYVVRGRSGRGWLFSLSAFGWLLEGATWWWRFGHFSDGFAFGPFWIGRRTYA